MSSGHHPNPAPPRPSEQELDRALADPKIQARLARLFRIDRSFDLPYVAGYSRDGSIIYIDRHFPTKLQVGSRSANFLQALATHEHTEKTLIDVYGWKYQQAHHLATMAEHRVVRALGFLPKEYEKAVQPYIKADAHEKLKRVPPQLDLTPYIDDNDYPTLFRLRSLMNASAWRAATTGRFPYASDEERT